MKDETRKTLDFLCKVCKKTGMHYFAQTLQYGAFHIEFTYLSDTGDENVFSFNVDRLTIKEVIEKATAEIEPYKRSELNKILLIMKNLSRERKNNKCEQKKKLKTK